MTQQQTERQTEEETGLQRGIIRVTILYTLQVLRICMIVRYAHKIIKTIKNNQRNIKRTEEM